MIIRDLGKVCLLIIFCSFAVSCSKKEDNSEAKMKKEREALALKERKEQFKLDQLKIKEKELELAQKEAAAKAEKKRVLEEQLLQEVEEAKQKLADEREAARLKEIAKRQKIQQLALRDYLKTEYDELELLDGKVLKSAKVTAASPVKVAFIHQNGVARVKYSNLPEEIRIACKYDKELETIELAERKAEKLEKLAMAASAKPKLNRSSNNSAMASSSSSEKNGNNEVKKPTAAEVTKVVRPRGKLSVRVVGTRKGGKTIEVIARSNVDAILYLNDYWRPYRTHRVKAGEVYTHTWTRVNVKYDVKLTAKGKILDRESSSRKSGLGGNGGL